MSLRTPTRLCSCCRLHANVAWVRLSAREIHTAMQASQSFCSGDTLVSERWIKCIMYQVCFYEGVWKAPLCICPLKPSSLQLSTSRCSEQAAMDFQLSAVFTDATASMSVVAGPSVNVARERRSPQRSRYGRQRVYVLAAGSMPTWLGYVLVRG